jgi:hypothetical protein
MDAHTFKLTRQSRVVAVAMAASIITVFAVAGGLTPDEKGYGTHRQLGLPSCQFRELTGLNCPQCGMTTSFAHIVRGEIAEAWRVNPCGPLLAALLGLIVLPWCLIAGTTGYSPGTQQPGMVAVRLVGVYVFVAIFVWLFQSGLFN